MTSDCSWTNSRKRSIILPAGLMQLGGCTPFPKAPVVWQNTHWNSALWRPTAAGMTRRCAAPTGGDSRKKFKNLIVRDRPSSSNDLISLALVMDSRLNERRLERAQRSRGSSRAPDHRLGPLNTTTFGATPVPSLPPSRPLLTRPLEEDEPMQLGRSRLSPEVREQRMHDRLCLYCGKAGHLISTCPTRPKDPAH